MLGKWRRILEEYTWRNIWAKQRISSLVRASRTWAPFLSPFFICRIRDGLKRSSTFSTLCSELRTRSQLMAMYWLSRKDLYPNMAFSRLRNSMRKESRNASLVSLCSMSLKIISLSASLLKYSPVPYTSHLLMMPGGNMRTLLRMAASSFATGLSSSDATMSMGVYPGVAS